MFCSINKKYCSSDVKKKKKTYITILCMAKIWEILFDVALIAAMIYCSYDRFLHVGSTAIIFVVAGGWNFS